MSCCAYFRRFTLFVIPGLVLFFGFLSISDSDEYLSGIIWPEPPVITPGVSGSAPSDATVLFDGSNLDQWDGAENWRIEDGVAVPVSGGMVTKEGFGDCQLHVEWAAPEKVEGSGQGRGNSGIYLMGKYEVQVLDSYDNETYFDGQCGAIYKQSPPMVNACRKPGEWQTFDIVFETPRFAADGKLTKPGAVTVFHNGVVVQNHHVLQGSTAWDAAPAFEAHPDKLPLHIQFHGNPVKFRNIWIRELHPIVGRKP
jgi:hypothetical protein